jgi:hypothetical protein
MNVCPDLSHLPEEQRPSLRRVTVAFPEVLTNKLGLCSLVGIPYAIQGNKPVRSPP